MRIQGWCTVCRKIKHVRAHAPPVNSIAWGVCRDCEEEQHG